MKLHQVIVSGVLAFVCSLLVLAAPQRSPKPSKHTVGLVKGIVGNGSLGSGGPWRVVIEHGSAKQEIDTDVDGHFETTLVPGVYAAHVRPTNRKLDKEIQRVPFLVKSNGLTNVVLDPTSEYVYCTSGDERVIPLRISDTLENNLKGLRRPKIDTFQLDPSDKESRKVTIEYCGKTKSDRLIRYRSAIVRSDTVGVLADNVALYLESYKLESEGRILLIQPNGTKGEVSRITASLRGGIVIIMEARFRKD